MSNFTVGIKGHLLEFFEDTHTYLVDGVEVPSVTTILAKVFEKKYAMVPPDVLQKARARGEEVHQAVEHFIRTGKGSPMTELRNFRFLRRQLHFDVLGCEVPLVLFSKKGKPIMAGRCDLVLEMKGETGGADIKSTYTLDREYLMFQLNLYRIGYFQSYGVNWEFLKGIHLKDEKRRFIDIPISEVQTAKVIKKYIKEDI